MVAKRDTFDTHPVNVVIHPVVRHRIPVVVENALLTRLKNKLVEVDIKERIRLYLTKKYNHLIIGILYGPYMVLMVEFLIPGL